MLNLAVVLGPLVVLIAGVALLIPGARVTRRRVFGWLPAVAIGGFIFSLALLSVAGEKKPAQGRPEGEPAVKKLVKPKNWPEGHPLPMVGSNCASCHLTAGQQLTDAVINFVRSTHDLNEMTCYDCHGGNTRDDVKAHEEDFGFIGTKKSAHIANCSACHDEAAEALAAGPHHWDFSQRINTEYPMCFDCHGNHDVGNPPADFKLAAMCGDCHDKFEKEFPQLASVVLANDRLWDILRAVRKRNVNQPAPVPESFRKDVDALRHDTMHLIHTSQEVDAAQAKKMVERSDSLRKRLAAWLQSKP